MAPKQTPKPLKKKVKIVVPKVQALATVPTKERRMAWGGVMPPTPKDEKNVAEINAFCNAVSLIYGIPSLGINAMGGRPYVNKDGLMFLLKEFERDVGQPVKSMKTTFLQMSTAPNIAAICEKTIVFKNGIEMSATGEASVASVKLAAVQTTLNMMAETRATNRVIRLIVTEWLWKRVSENLGNTKLDDEQRSRILDAGRSSYEEMDRPEAPAKNAVPKKTDDDTLITYLKQRIDEVEGDDLKKFTEMRDKLAKGKSTDKVKTEVGEYLDIKIKAANTLLDMRP